VPKSFLVAFHLTLHHPLEHAKHLQYCKSTALGLFVPGHRILQALRQGHLMPFFLLGAYQQQSTLAPPSAVSLYATAASLCVAPPYTSDNVGEPAVQPHCDVTVCDRQDHLLPPRGGHCLSPHPPP